jgi:uncharacterized protein (DUF2267 family)
MQYDHFLGQVQHRARLASGGDALRAVAATLQTLAERLAGQEARHLAAQLPSEVGDFLMRDGGEAEGFDYAEFLERVARRLGESVDPPQAAHQARSVMATVRDAVAPGQIAHVRSQLPEDYDTLFEFDEETGDQAGAEEAQKGRSP